MAAKFGVEVIDACHMTSSAGPKVTFTSKGSAGDFTVVYANPGTSTLHDRARDVRTGAAVPLTY